MLLLDVYTNQRIPPALHSFHDAIQCNQQTGRTVHLLASPFLAERDYAHTSFFLALDSFIAHTFYRFLQFTAM
jgi:hypothetical protein